MVNKIFTFVSMAISQRAHTHKPHLKFCTNSFTSKPFAFCCRFFVSFGIWLLLYVSVSISRWVMRFRQQVATFCIIYANIDSILVCVPFSVVVLLFRIVAPFLLLSFILWCTIKFMNNKYLGKIGKIYTTPAQTPEKWQSFLIILQFSLNVW